MTQQSNHNLKLLLSLSLGFCNDAVTFLFVSFLWLRFQQQKIDIRFAKNNQLTSADCQIVKKLFCISFVVNK
jgi:hypothetical protein